MSETNTSSRLYEMMFIISPMLAEEKRKSVMKEIEDLIKEEGGQVTQTQDWGKREMSYRIKKQEEGYYHIFWFTLENPENLHEIDEHMRLDQGILRHMIVKRDEDYEIVDYIALNAEEEKKAANEGKVSEGGIDSVVKKPKAKKVDEKAKEEAKAKKEEDKAASKEALDKKLEEIISDTDIEI